MPEYKNPNSFEEAIKPKLPEDVEHKSFLINPAKDGQIYNVTNTSHPEVSQGYMSTRTPNRNKIFHTRQYTYDIDGKKVSIAAEGQSGAYKLSEKPEEIPLEFPSHDRS